MRLRLSYAVMASCFALGAVWAAPASAQATRTWVSGVGDDVNPCSRTAPCKTFAGAISKTAAGGEINCLDPGGFGAVTIIKSMTINCIYTEGGALAGGNGIVLNMPATTDVAVIRGLDIFGVNPPTNGIRFVNNGTLIVEDTTIRRFNAAGSFGISFQPSGSARLIVRRTTITQNGNGGTGGGILIQPTGAGGNARVHIGSSDIFQNANDAIRVDTTSNTNLSGIVVSVENSRLSGSTNGVNVITPVGTNSAIVNVNDSEIFNNPGSALAVNGANSIIRVSNNTITTNGFATTIAGGGTISSYNDNRTVGNSNPPTFTPPTLTRN